MTAADEQQLILRVKEGSHDAFRILVERYMKHAYNIAYGFFCDHDEAEDIAQESFVRVYESINGFRGDSNFNTWLYRIVTNVSLNKLRQRKKMQTQSLGNMADSYAWAASEPSDNHHQEIRIALERAIHELPTLQRAVVILRHMNGLSTRQVSNILRCSEGTVKTHLFRGLKKMKAKVGFLKNEAI